MKFSALALVAVSAIQNKEAAHLVNQALAMTEAGSEAKIHLENALSAMTTKSDAEVLDSHSQTVSVPIDEKRALTLKVSPTYTLDEVNSVTLKSFNTSDKSLRMQVCIPSQHPTHRRAYSAKTGQSFTSLRLMCAHSSKYRMRAPNS